MFGIFVSPEFEYTFQKISFFKLKRRKVKCSVSFYFNSYKKVFTNIRDTGRVMVMPLAYELKSDQYIRH